MGKQLAHYEILEPLGAGGMGEVYRARDTKLERDVAIKLLPEGLADDPERLARFEREAKLLASLNHTNIAAVYGLENADDRCFIAMELVEGRTLAEHIAGSGRIEVDEAVEIARQIAVALSVAHGAGIVHRDLKPANVRITPAGEVKVLDFGLAKALEPVGGAAGADQDPAQSPTVTSLGTRAGVILGTAAYMAPEQTRGRGVDHRADIWAFGVVLYEMLAGARLFSGEAISDTMAAVLTKDPDFDAVPARVRRLLRACLQRDPNDRLRDIGDAMLLVEEDDGLAARVGSEGAAGATTGKGPTPPLTWILRLAALLAAAVAGAALVKYVESPEAPATRIFFEPAPAGGRFVGAPIPSPDGRHLAMVVETSDGQIGVWARSLDDTAARLLDGIGETRRVVWSPDSSELLYVGSRTLYRVRRDGSFNREVLPLEFFDAMTWAPDGNVYFASVTNGLRRVSADGGEPDTILAYEGFTFRSIEYVAAGPHLLLHQFGDSNGIYALDTDGANRRAVVPGLDSTVRFLPPDNVVYVDNRVLVAQRVDPQTMTPIGDPQPVAANVGSADFETSAAGIITFVPWSARRSVLVNFSRDGTLTEGTNLAAEYRELRLSPDGSKLMYVAADPVTGNQDLWLQDLPDGAPNRFSTAPDVDHLIAFHPDGSQVVWESHSGGNLVIMRRPTDMSAPGETLLEWNRGGGPSDWSPDGTFILYHSTDGATQGNLWGVPLDGGEPRAIIDSEFDDRQGRFSPDGTWLAYASDASGRPEIYLQRLDGMERVGGPLRVSTNGGSKPQWRADGEELFFVQDTTLMAVPIDLTADRPHGTPEALFDLQSRRGLERQLVVGSYDYVVAPDGQSFVAIMESGGTEANAATVIVGWDGR